MAEESTSSTSYTTTTTSNTSTTTSSEESEEKSCHNKIIEKPLENLPTSPSLATSKQNERVKKPKVSVCLTHCHAKVVRRIVANFGFDEVGIDENWNFMWTEYISVDRCREMKRFQKINHFPGVMQISRKDLLARNLTRMLRRFPKEYNFFPRTWVLPADLGEVLTYGRVHKNKSFILKPDTGCKGRGIVVTKDVKTIKPHNRGICQLYITRPFLIDGYKFDLRLYVLITSCDPLRIYVYNEGLLRFATARYKEPEEDNMGNVFMHLTNYAVNKNNRMYNPDEEEGSKRKLTWFYDYLKSFGWNIEPIVRSIDDVLIKTIITAHSMMKHGYVACFPNHDVMPACCELLGIDVILDRDLNPQILEVNSAPSLHCDTPLDKIVKEELLTDMFNLINLEYCDKSKVMREDRKRIRNRLLSNKEETNHLQHDFSKFFDEENYNRGKFRLIYPLVHTCEKYDKFFDSESPLYGETSASHSREVAKNKLREKMQMRAKVEEAKRLAPKLPSIPGKGNECRTVAEIRAVNPLDSSIPHMIIESEEKDRLQKLAQRELLIKNLGILEVIYFSMKKNGNLRPKEERKYANLDKMRNKLDTSNKNAIAVSHSLLKLKLKS